MTACLQHLNVHLRTGCGTLLQQPCKIGRGGPDILLLSFHEAHAPNIAQMERISEKGLRPQMLFLSAAGCSLKLATEDSAMGQVAHKGRTMPYCCPFQKPV